MRFRTTVQLLVLAALLAMLVWFARGPAKHADGPDRVIPGFIPGEVTRLRIERGDLAVEFARTPECWTILKPIRARASDAEIERLLAAIEGLRRHETITEQQRSLRHLTLADYGLDPKPRVRFEFGSGERTRVLSVGRDAPVGGLLYVRLASENDVLATETNILAALPPSLDSVRDREVIHGDVAGITEFEIERAAGGFIRAVKGKDVWFMQQPVRNARLSTTKVRELLKSLIALRALKFIDRMDPAAHGLDESDATLQVSVKTGGGAGTQQKLLLGKVASGGTEVYARLAAQDGVFTVDASILSALNAPADELRDRMLLPYRTEDITAVMLRDGERKVALRKSPDDGWSIAEPRSHEADPLITSQLVRRILSLRVERFLDSSATNLGSIALLNAPRSIRICGESRPAVAAGETAPDGSESVKIDRELLLGAPVGDGVYARFSNETAVVTVEGPILEALLSGTYGSAIECPPASASNGVGSAWWVSPALYCSRNVLRLDASAVNSMVLVKSGETQEVRRDGVEAEWRRITPAAGTAATNVIAEILGVVSRLEALRVVCSEQDELASYGLDNPGVRLTLGLTGDESISRTLLIGFLARADGVYAMVQGEDVVFVLPREIVGRMMRDIVLPAAAEPATGGTFGAGNTAAGARNGG